MPHTIDIDPAAWAREFQDGAILAREHALFGTQLWHLLGPAAWVREEGDWITASIGGKSVFVQRFRDDLAAFENVCAHRFYPLREGARGNGPLRCGFHGWMYNRHGEAIGVPLCEELYGRTRRELNRRLRPVALAQCGGLLFGRLPGENGPSLEAYLGELAPILARLTEELAPASTIETIAEANWKFCCHAALDESGGRPVFHGLHSAAHDGEQPLRLHIFPSVTMTIAGSVSRISRYTPLSESRTRHDTWAFAAETEDLARRDHAAEDTLATQLQSAVPQIWAPPIFGAGEERIAHFDAAYGSLMRS